MPNVFQGSMMAKIEFECGKCGRRFSLDAEFAGRTTACSTCKTPLVVPTPMPRVEATVAPAAKQRITFCCQKCGTKFSVLPEFAGRSTTCATCKDPLVVPSPEMTVAYVPSPGKLDGALSSLARLDVPSQLTLGGAAAGVSSLNHALEREGGHGARYVIENELARGGMGAVLRAIDCDIRREVAVKYLLDQSNAKNKIRFVEEAQITGQLEHPNIVPIHEIGVDSEKRLFFSMKMVKGRSLAQILKQSRSNVPTENAFGANRLLNILISVCNALSYAHSRGVVHRDLKPANVMVGDFGEVYVMDWGLAKVLDRKGVETGVPMAIPVTARTAASAAAILAPSRDNSANSSSASPSFSAGSGRVVTSRDSETELTNDGTILGTPVYMPPEQAAGQLDAIDERSDVYSLGAILYEILTQKPPIDREGGFPAIVLRVAQGEIVPPEKRAPELAQAGKIAPEAAAVAMKALALRKEDRYPTVDAFRKDIERFLEGRSVSAKQDTLRETALKLVKRNKAVSIATAAAAGLLILVAGGFFKANYSARVRAENNYDAYLKEQEKRMKQGRESLPSLLTAAKLLLDKRDFDSARAQIGVALNLKPDDPDFRNLRGQLALISGQFVEGRQDLEAYTRHRPKDALAFDLLDWLDERKGDDVANKLGLARAFSRHEAYAMADGTLQSLGKDAATARQRLLALYRGRLNAAWPGTADALSVDQEKGTFHLNLVHTHNLPHLEPLRGIPLTSLILNQCVQLRDLTPLESMPLTSLVIAGCESLRDLRPLENLRLEELNLSVCANVRDLAPLSKLKLKKLVLHGCRSIEDLTPLRGMPLARLDLAACAVKSLSPLEGMPLEYLNLTSCPVADLTPLKGMPLRWLDIGATSVVKLTPIEDLPLEFLRAGGALKDMTPLRKLKLRELHVTHSYVYDLGPLREMPLQMLNLRGNSFIEDLEPLNKNRELDQLNLILCGKVRDLTPIKDLAIKTLFICATKVTDVTPLAYMKLEEIRLDPGAITKGMDALRRMKSLKFIGPNADESLPAPEFWARFDKGEFSTTK